MEAWLEQINLLEGQIPTQVSRTEHKGLADSQILDYFPDARLLLEYKNRLHTYIRCDSFYKNESFCVLVFSWVRCRG